MRTLICGLGILLAVLGGGDNLRAADKPNIILILADDLGGRDLGCYGSTYHQTPHLDRLAANGMRFTDAYAAGPVCSPSRAALLTGKYPARLNLTDWLPGRPDRPDQRLLRPALRQELPLEETTLAELLKAAGYATAHIGKWHLGGKGFGPCEQGFDVNIGGTASDSTRSFFSPYGGKGGSSMPGLDDAPEGEYLTDRLTAEALRFIEANRDRPFFLHLAHYAVHIPLQARPEIAAKYKPGGPPGTQNNPIYAAMLESLDDGVGAILNKLDNLKLSEKTVVIFTSDNGGLSVREGPSTPATSNAPLREAKGYLYDGGIRVPLLLRWPGATQAGAVSRTPVCGIDLFPTVVDLCGLHSNAAVDGVSLAPLLRGGTLSREGLFWHYPHYSNQGGKPGGAVRACDFKLVEFYEDGRRELYDLKNDVGENRNRAEEKPEKVKELAAKLDAWRLAVGARGMKPNPAYVPNPQADDGTVTLPARTADVHGVQLRYEPLPHKHTLGFWVRQDDWASWDFTIRRPGQFSLEVLQGCGKGQGAAKCSSRSAARSYS
jgi:arylsulfatase A-like enzyme